MKPFLLDYTANMLIFTFNAAIGSRIICWDAYTYLTLLVAIKTMHNWKPEMKTYPIFLAAFVTIAVIVLSGCEPSPTPILELPTELPYYSLQLENNLPITHFAPRPFEELPDNHIGVHFEDYSRYSDTDDVYMVGFKWMRIQSLTRFWAFNNSYDLATFSLTSIPQSVDDLISEYIDNGVNIVLDLWLGAGLTPYGTTFQTEEEINQYLDYVRFVVSHFRNRIKYYQIWNEPFNMTPGEYANLVRRAIPVIREEDPGARIIINGIRGNWENGYPGYGYYQRYSLDMVYLNELLLSGVLPLVDGISWHPFYGNIPDDPYYQNYPQMVHWIKDLGESQGFTGEYFADELLWATVTEEDWDGGPPVSQHVAAKYYTRAITMHRGLDVNVTINTWFQEPFTEPIHYLCDILAGVEPTDITLTLASDATNVMHYGFALPNGDRLVALWTNDGAGEHNLGVSATLTFPGLSASKVVGINVLDGFEQQLITRDEDGNLVISGLFVKDYPVIIRFSSASSL